MLTIIFRTIRDRKFSILSYSLASVGFLWMYVALFPSIQKEAARMSELLKSYPEALMKAFNIQDLNFDTLEKFLAMEQMSFVWPILVIILAVSYAGGSLASEIEKGTIEILLAAPLSRLKIYFSRYFAGFIILIFFNALSFFSVMPLAEIYDIKYVFKNYLTLFIMASLFSLAVFSISYFLSAIFSERSKVYVLAGGTLLLMYVLNVVALLKDNLKNLKYFSFFHYFDSSAVLIKNEVELTSVIVFCAVIFVFTVFGALWFNGRDIAV